MLLDNRGYTTSRITCRAVFTQPHRFRGDVVVRGGSGVSAVAVSAVTVSAVAVADDSAVAVGGGTPLLQLLDAAAQVEFESKS